MQRQSLGSPSSSSKLVITNDHHLITTTSSSSSSSSISTSTIINDEYSKDKQSELLSIKKLKLKTKTTTPPESYIHIIPMLTLLCFLILYLSSHDPSLNDMAEFNGSLKAFTNPITEDDNNISELESIVDIKKGDILGIRSLKNLNQGAEADISKHRLRLHRKIPSSF